MIHNPQIAMKKHYCGLRRHPYSVARVSAGCAGLDLWRPVLEEKERARGMVQIQYASDLHIDGWPAGTSFFSFLTPVAPILILAGDICSVWHPLYTPFLTWCSRHWAYVFVLAGNHEYHNAVDMDEATAKTLQEADEEIWGQCRKLGNVFYLQGGASYVIPGTRLRFVGATLWSDVDTALWTEAATKKGDCRKIFIDTPRGEKRRILPADLCALHAAHRAALSGAIGARYAEDERLVVITHHMPTLELLEPHYRGEKWSSFYASNDECLIGPWVAAWICGHGHRGTRLVLRGTTLLMNARGYNNSNDVGRSTDLYNPAAIFSL